MEAHTGLCLVGAALSVSGAVLAAYNGDWLWCGAYVGLWAVSTLMLRRSLKMASMPPREDRREDDPKGRIGA